MNHYQPRHLRQEPQELEVASKTDSDLTTSDALEEATTNETAIEFLRPEEEELIQVEGRDHEPTDLDHNSPVSSPEEVFAALGSELNALDQEQLEGFRAFVHFEHRLDDTPVLLLQDFQDRYCATYNNLNEWAEEFLQEQRWQDYLIQLAYQIGIPRHLVEINRRALIDHYFGGEPDLLVAYRSPGKVHVLFA